MLGHRLSEWCGHGPILEEDIALANIALDLIGQATLFLQLAGEVEGKGRDEDALAYFRDAVDYRNVAAGRAAEGRLRRHDRAPVPLQRLSRAAPGALQRAADTELAGIAAKALKEARYHVRHSGEWVVKLGDGTEESHRRVAAALDELWRYTGELFAADDVDRLLAGAGVGVDPAALEPAWREIVSDVVRRGDAHAAARRGTCIAAAARDGTPSTSATCWPRCRSSRARTRGRSGDVAQPPREALFELLDEVKDPEVPVLSIVELGIVRDVESTRRSGAVTVTPTYSGCPAMRVIEQDIVAALARARLRPRRVGRCTRRRGRPTG